VRLLDNLVRQAGEEGIRDVGQEQSQRGGRAMLQLPRGRAGVVAKGFHDLTDAAPGRGSHRAGPRVENPGDNGDGHPRSRGNIANGRLLLHVYSSIGYCGSPGTSGKNFFRLGY
jgi:hypothetical protein